MRFICMVMAVFYLSGCVKKNNEISPTGGSNNGPTPVDEEKTVALNLVQEENDIIEKYKAFGVTLEFWPHQDPKIRQREIEQLNALSPEIAKRSDYIKKLEVSPYQMHWYKNESKLLEIDLQHGEEAAIKYLSTFEKIREYEKKLNGIYLERSGETTDLLEVDLKYYESVSLAELVHERSCLKAFHPSAFNQYVQGAETLYIRTGSTANEIQELLDGICSLKQFTTELDIGVEDKTANLDPKAFFSVVSTLKKQKELILPVANLFKKIEITRDFSDSIFDLDARFLKLSRFDIDELENFWPVLANYKDLSDALKIPIEIPSELRKIATVERLKEGLHLVAIELEDLKLKFGKIKSLRLSFGDTSRLSSEGVLWVASEQPIDQFKAFIDAL